MFIYALMGIQLFSHIKPTGALDEVMNFKTLSGALMVLFSMMTGTGWTRIFLVSQCIIVLSQIISLY